MATLADVLLTDENRPRLVRACVTLIDAEVADKRGVSGLAIKAGFKTVKAVKPGIIPDVTDLLLDVRALLSVSERPDLTGEADAGQLSGRSALTTDPSAAPTTNPATTSEP